MNSISNRLRQYLLTNNSWIYLGLLLTTAVSYANIFGANSWVIFSKAFLTLLITFSPIIIFVHFQHWLKSKFNATVYIILWFLIFIGYPQLVTPFSNNEVEYLGWVKYDVNYFFPLFIIFALLEIILIGNNLFSEKLNGSTNSKNINVKKGILISLAIISLLLSFLIFPHNLFEQLSLVKSAFLLLSNGIQLFFLLLTLGLFIWINYKFLVPVLFKERGFLIYLLGASTTVLLIFPLLSQLINWLPLFAQRPELLYEDGAQIFADINAFVPFFLILGSMPIILAIQWQKQHFTIQQLQQENTEAELNLLKQQINPHFFFNTLNNLYSLALEKSDKGAEAIMKLSELMRYVIYKGKEKLVPLQEEINYLKDYISLQQIRFHKTIEVNFDLMIQEASFDIAPLLLTEPIENAFKHGISPSTESCFLNISIKTQKNVLTFQCVNSFEFDNTAPKGIGLKNLKRRLALLYPNTHEIKISTNENIFTLDLKLWRP